MNQRNTSYLDILAGFIYNKITDLLNPIISIKKIEYKNNGLLRKRSWMS